MAEMVSVDLRNDSRVLVENLPVFAPIPAQAGVLGTALARHDEQRGERSEDEEPVRERHVCDDATRDCTEYEARRHDGKLDHWLALQAEAVGDAQGRVRPDDDGEAPRSDEERGGDGDARSGMRRRGLPSADAGRHWPPAAGA